MSKSPRLRGGDSDGLRLSNRPTHYTSKARQDGRYGNEYRRFVAPYLAQRWSMEAAAAAWRHKKETGETVRVSDTNARRRFEPKNGSVSRAMSQYKRRYPHKSLSDIADMIKRRQTNQKEKEKPESPRTQKVNPLRIRRTVKDARTFTRTSTSTTTVPAPPVSWFEQDVMAL